VATSSAPAGAPKSQTAVVVERLPNPNEYWSPSPIEGTSYAVVGAKGSLAAGVLLGPIAVAANVAYVKQTNKERGEGATALTKTDRRAVLKAIRARAAAAGDAAASSGKGYELVPTVQIFFPNADSFAIGCTITASLPAAAGGRPWRARYGVALEPTYD